MFYCTRCPSPLGDITLASDGECLCGLWMQGQKYFGASIPQPLTPMDDLPVFHTVKGWLQRYFAAQRPDAAELALRPIGSAFRQGVWALLQDVPYGHVITYGELAQKMAARLGRQTMSSQAVGGAVAHNPISIIIPCHRVIGADGSLTGYAGGVHKKLALLGLEGACTKGLTLPK